MSNHKDNIDLINAVDRELMFAKKTESGKWDLTVSDNVVELLNSIKDIYSALEAERFLLESQLEMSERYVAQLRTELGKVRAEKANKTYIDTSVDYVSVGTPEPVEYVITYFDSTYGDTTS